MGTTDQATTNPNDPNNPSNGGSSGLNKGVVGQHGIGAISGPSNAAMYGGFLTDSVGNTLDGFGNIVKLNNATTPPTPLESLQSQASIFRSNLPQMQQQMASSMGQGINQQTQQNLSANKTNNSTRGLLYGGINQGQQAAVRGQGQVQMAQGREMINSQLNSAADQMDQGTISQGMALQNVQQNMQNAIYQQAMMNMMSQNQMYGSLVGAGAMGAGMAMS